MAATPFSIDESLFSRLKDKVVIITGTPTLSTTKHKLTSPGGSTGIGRATVSLFAAHGAHVTVADLNTAETPIPGTAFVELDVTSWKSLANLFKETSAKHGRIDIVFANAGVAMTDNYVDSKVGSDGEVIEPTHRTLEINLKACINTVVLALHYMKSQPHGGSVVVTASASSYQRFIATDYTAAKHGVLGLMRGLVDQLPANVRINAIAPSWTDTRIVPREALAEIGVSVQGTEVVARSVGVLAVDESRCGETVYSSNGVYREIEGPVLRATREVIGEKVDEGKAALRMMKTGAGFGRLKLGARAQEGY